MELAALKESLRKLAPHAIPLEPGSSRSPLPTSHPELDALLAGGIPRGAITEIAGDVSSGKTALTLSMTAARTRESELVGYLDGRGELYPPTAAALGVQLSRLLVVSFARSQALEIDLARAAEILIRSRHVPLLVLDLPSSHSLSAKRATRLRQLAHETGTALITLTSQPQTVVGAALRMRVWPHFSAARAGRRPGLRQLEIHLDKGSHSARRTTVELSPYRIDHCPPRPLADLLDRAQPGEPPAPPARCGNHSKGTVS